MQVELGAGAGIRGPLFRGDAWNSGQTVMGTGSPTDSNGGK